MTRLPTRRLAASGIVVIIMIIRPGPCAVLCLLCSVLESVVLVSGPPAGRRGTRMSGLVSRVLTALLAIKLTLWELKIKFNSLTNEI